MIWSMELQHWQHRRGVFHTVIRRSNSSHEVEKRNSYLLQGWVLSWSQQHCNHTYLLQEENLQNLARRHLRHSIHISRCAPVHFAAGEVYFSSDGVGDYFFCFPFTAFFRSVIWKQRKRAWWDQSEKLAFQYTCIFIMIIRFFSHNSSNLNILIITIDFSILFDMVNSCWKANRSIFYRL